MSEAVLTGTGTIGGHAAVLIATGLVIAVVQVERPAALVGTAYGLLLLTKLAGVAGLIALATINRLRLTPALEAGNPVAATRLRHSIGLEIGCRHGVGRGSPC